jgi:hypothetical protein
MLGAFVAEIESLPSRYHSTVNPNSLAGRKGGITLTTGKWKGSEMKAPVILSAHQQETFKKAVIDGIVHQLEGMPDRRVLAIYDSIIKVFAQNTPAEDRKPMLRLVTADENLDKSVSSGRGN